MSKPKRYPAVHRYSVIVVGIEARKPPKGTGYAICCQLLSPTGGVVEQFAHKLVVTMGATGRGMEFDAILAFLTDNNDSSPVYFKLSSDSALKTLNKLPALTSGRLRASALGAYADVLKRIAEISQHRPVTFMKLEGKRPARIRDKAIVELDNLLQAEKHKAVQK